MLFSSLLVAAASLLPHVLGCAQHANNKRSVIKGRQAKPVESNTNTTKDDWAYEASVSPTLIITTRLL